MPAAPAGTLAQQVQQQYTYLFRLAQTLNRAMEQVECTAGAQAAQAQRTRVSSREAREERAHQAATLKSLIIKSADVVRQELASERGIAVSLRTVERAVAPHRQRLLASALATVRFETRPGEQMQIDFGERRVTLGGEAVQRIDPAGIVAISNASEVRGRGFSFDIGLRKEIRRRGSNV